MAIRRAWGDCGARAAGLWQEGRNSPSGWRRITRGCVLRCACVAALCAAEPPLDSVAAVPDAAFGLIRATCCRKTEGVAPGHCTLSPAQPLPRGEGLYRSRHRFGVLRGAHGGLGAEQLGDARGGVTALGPGGHAQVGTAHGVATGEHARVGGLV